MQGTISPFAPFRVVAKGLHFPEGPVVLPDGSIAVVEVASGTIARIDPVDGSITRIAETGAGPNGLAIGPDGWLYVCNNGGTTFREELGLMHSVPGTPAAYLGGSIQKVNPQTGEVRQLYKDCDGQKLCSPNDIVFDAFGGFYFTDFGKTRSRDRDLGWVYYALADGSAIQQVVHPIANPNGIGLSPDQSMLYVAETETARLWSFPIRGPGLLLKDNRLSPSGGKLVVGLGGYQRLDSLALDEDGSICVATLVTGCVTVITPGGEVTMTVLLPDTHTTNICFAGKDMRTAYITQSSRGELLAVFWPKPGLRLNYQNATPA